MSDKRVKERSGKAQALCAHCYHDVHPKRPCPEPVLPLGEPCGCLPKPLKGPRP